MLHLPLLGMFLLLLHLPLPYDLMQGGVLPLRFRDPRGGAGRGIEWNGACGASGVWWSGICTCG